MIPRQTLLIRDPGLGLVDAATNAFLFIGTATGGPIGEVRAVSSPAAAVDLWGDGPLVEDVAEALVVAGGPVYGVRVAGSIAPTTGTVTATRVGTSTGTITVAGDAADRYDVLIEVTGTGALGVGTFRYSLDKGATWSDVMTIPAGGTYAIPRTGLTVTFVPGGGPTLFQRGDRHAFSTTAPHYGATEVAAAFTALSAYLATAPGLDLDAVVLTGENATAAAAVTLFATLGAQLSALQAQYRYLGAIMDAGSADTRVNVKTGFAAVADRRILAAYGRATVASGKPMAGFALPTRPAATVIAARAASALPSTDLARVASGPLQSVTAISHDEFTTEEMDAAGIATLRTWPGLSGFFVTNGRMKAPVGSDFRYWQHRRLMDLACRTVVKVQQNFVGISVGTNPDGTIDETDAQTLEAAVNGPLRAALLDPKNEEGRKGYVTAFKYTIDRNANILQTGILRSSVAIQPDAYTKEIETEIGFAIGVTAQAA